jgi:hypothetical protein
LQTQALPKLSKSSNNEISNFFVILVARDLKHISCDATLYHVFSCDAVVAKCEEDPRHISLDYLVIQGSEAVEKIHNILLY